MKWIAVLMTIMTLAACVAENVPPGEMDRMRAEMPKDKDPPASYNRHGMGVP